MTQVFAALGEPSRAEIVRRLATQGRQPLGRLVEGLGVTRQAATRHLYILRDAGVVRVERTGREQQCELSLETVRRAEEWLKGLEKVWDERLDALQRHLDGV